jgi:P4 family phage/plasmid primase-like protien
LWRHDDSLQHFDYARAICREAAVRIIGRPKTADDVASAKAVSATVRLACADRRHAAVVGQWDHDPELMLGHLVTNGSDSWAVIDLRDGRRQQPLRADYFTKAMAAIPEGDCKQWFAFLARVTAQDAELQSYLQRVAGYCLSGLTKEHTLFFLHGTGGNGKGVFLNTLRGIWGDYAVVAPMEIFLASSHERHPTELAYLRGARLVVAQEITSGKKWDEAKIKTLTGGDPISARYMRQDFFELMPQFKLLIAGNNKPLPTGVNHAIRRRLHLILFTVTIPANEVDTDLTGKLQAEWSGILRWAIDGFNSYREIGLAPPPVVVAATEAYLIEEDSFGRSVEECCVLSKQSGASATTYGHLGETGPKATTSAPASPK